MRGRARKSNLPRFVPSGRENITPKALSQNIKSEKGLKECAMEVASAIGNKISESQKRIDDMVSEIARLESIANKKKLGFQSKLKCRKDEIAAKHQELIREIQSAMSVQLAENEKLAAQISKYADELDQLAKPREIVIPEPKTVDLSSKTEKILKEREEEMRQKCSEEFRPFFEKLEQQHLDNIESLRYRHQEELDAIEDQCQATIDSFVPKAFITKEELKLRQSYENTMKHEKAAFEAKKSAIIAKIRAIETERDKEMQRITDETDEAIFQGEQLLAQKIEEIRGLVVEPVVEEIPLDYKLTEQQEKDYREKITLDLKGDFERKLAEAVQEVADRRERMELEMKTFCEQRAHEADEKSRIAIANGESELAHLEQQICDSQEDIDSMKAEWTDMNHRRRDNEEVAKKLVSQNKDLQNKLSSLERELKQYIDAEDEQDHEIDEIQQEIDQLGRDVTSAKKKPIHWMKRASAEHESAMENVRGRVEALKQGKDDVILKLKTQIRETNHRAKKIQEDLQARMGKYQL